MKKSIEIRDPLHGMIEVDSFFVQIIDHPVFQRLRRIKQLDFMEFSFPGALHSRYLHSLGVFYLAERIFDQIFKSFSFSGKKVRGRLKTCFKLAALLHDIGHGPLSHASEKAMPLFKDLWARETKGVLSKNVSRFIKKLKNDSLKRKANHEDYTVKFLLDSSLSERIKEVFSDIDPLCISALIDQRINLEEDFFFDRGFNFRPILSQLISSDLDLDRMDYLGRDAYFCGVNLSRVDLDWLISNMTYYEKGGNLFLALYRRAFPSFEQFLFTRHQMRLMVYFHYKSVIYKEILNRYFSSTQGSFHLPSHIEEYVHFVDSTLFEHLLKEKKNMNPWAKRIVDLNPHQLVFEFYPKIRISDLKTSHFSENLKNEILKKEKSFDTKTSQDISSFNQVEKIYHILKENRLQVILSRPFSHFNFFSSFSPPDSSKLGQNPETLGKENTYPALFLINAFNSSQDPQSIESEESVKFFKAYERAHYVERLYVDKSEVFLARKYLKANLKEFKNLF